MAADASSGSAPAPAVGSGDRASHGRMAKRRALARPSLARGGDRADPCPLTGERLVRLYAGSLASSGRPCSDSPAAVSAAPRRFEPRHAWQVATFMTVVQLRLSTNSPQSGRAMPPSSRTRWMTRDTVSLHTEGPLERRGVTPLVRHPSARRGGPSSLRIRERARGRAPATDTDAAGTLRAESRSGQAGSTPPPPAGVTPEPTMSDGCGIHPGRPTWAPG